MKRNVIYFFTFIVLVSTLFYCKSKKMDKNETPVIVNGKEVTKEILSPDKTKKLILTYTENINPRKNFSYKVLNTKTKKEILNGNFEGLKLEWNDNSSLRGHLYQGMISNDDNTSDADKFKIIQIK